VKPVHHGCATDAAQPFRQSRTIDHPEKIVIRWRRMCRETDEWRTDSPTAEIPARAEFDTAGTITWTQHARLGGIVRVNFAGFAVRCWSWDDDPLLRLSSRRLPTVDPFQWLQVSDPE
jgi:hypothetical protein